MLTLPHICASIYIYIYIYMVQKYVNIIYYNTAVLRIIGMTTELIEGIAVVLSYV
jgi:hypothetical protein